MIKLSNKSRVRIGNAWYDETYSRDGSRVLQRDYVGMVGEVNRCEHGEVYVKGYTKKDGTRVDGYCKRR